MLAINRRSGTSSRSAAAAQNGRPQRAAKVEAISKMKSAQQNSDKKKKVVVKVVIPKEISGTVAQLANSMTLPIGVIVVDEVITSYFLSCGFLVCGPKYIIDVPPFCVEAIKAGQIGNYSIRTKMPVGVPLRKFDEDDQETYGDESTNAVQSVHILEDGKGLVIYEGWLSTLSDRQPLDELKNTCPARVELAELRSQFIAARHRSKKNNGVLARLPDYDVLVHDPGDEIWRLDDLSYFATIIHEEFGLAPILYINLYKERVGKRMPMFSYSAVNVVDMDAFRFAFVSPLNQPFTVLSHNKHVTLSTGICNGPKCVCDERAKLLFEPDVKVLNYDANGRVLFTGAWRNSRRVLVECSDACGCDKDCPRRVLQRGQQCPLAISYETVKGFGVRALSDIPTGTLIAEYIGDVYICDEERLKDRKNPRGDRRDMTYQTPMNVLHEGLMIDAKYRGNVARFFNHSCAPNAAFVECYSRKNETDVLLPRVAVFATRKIKCGDEIMLCYWSTDLLGIQENSTLCQCKALTCKKYIPRS